MNSKNIYTEPVKNYKKIGLDPLPIPYVDGQPTKGPQISDWQTKAEKGQFCEEDFAGPCNIGILLGGSKNITDIDLDSPEAVAVGGDILSHLMERSGKTMMFGRAGKRRSHFVFVSDRSVPSERISDPVDGRCVAEYRCLNKDSTRGQQTVFPPSVWYEAAVGTEEIDFEQDSVPTPAFVESAKLHECFKMIAAVAMLARHFPAASERHDTILALAGVFAKSEMEVEKAAIVVKLAYRHSAGYNGDQNKAEDDVRSVYAAYAKDSNAHLFGYPKLVEIVPRPVVDKVLGLLGIKHPDATTYNLTDAGNGRRLVDKHHDEIRYCVNNKEWYVWDGVRWREDSVNRIRELAKGIAVDLRQEAQNMTLPDLTGDEERDKKILAKHDAIKRVILKWANQTENADRVSKTIISAASDAEITCFRSDFDQHGRLLNCANCVVDLYTGKTVPHDRKLMMSYLCPTEYHADATHPQWAESLAAFTRNHPDLPEFLKRFSGYSTQGDKSEERIVLLHGDGNAGKGTYLDWLTSALGPDYACAMDANSVLKQKRNPSAASGDVARLEGKRIVVVSEIEKGSRLQESFMKQASGNDALVARGVFKSEKEFRPTHQFWFQTNYRPGFDSLDSGNKRRYIEIPFDNVLSTDPFINFDPTLKIRMRRDPKFLQAVLAWCVQGCIEWRQHGLAIPDSVKAATAELFADNDFLKTFVTEMCVVEREEKVSVKEMWEGYKSWCEGQGEEPAQGRTFNRMLEERGFKRKQARVNGESGKVWTGIRLKTNKELSPSRDIQQFPSRKPYLTFFDGKDMVG